MKNIFVFPCGSEIALEIAKSLVGDSHFHLIGGTSVSDHGRFVFEDIEENLPWETDKNFISRISEVVQNRKIDCIYPAMDTTICRLKEAENILQCPIVSSDLKTAQMCLSKRQTYKMLCDVIKTPKLYDLDHVFQYPVFVKPDIGYGSRGTSVITGQEELVSFLKNKSNMLICEYLSGEEYTVDCFTDRHGTLLYCGPRIRARTMNGISVFTCFVAKSDKDEFKNIAMIINDRIKFRGAWFFQLKRNADGNLVLLEIAARLGGSSALNRALGVNFAQLSIWDTLNYDVTVANNNFDVEMDRALDNKFKFKFSYNEVFMDYDDTLLMNNNTYNLDVIQFIFKCFNNHIPITLLSKHKCNLIEELKDKKINWLFSRIIHIPIEAKKSSYIDNQNAIFIDDSFAERKEVLDECKIPVFGLDMVLFL